MYIWKRTRPVWPMAPWSSLSEQWRGLWQCAEGGGELNKRNALCYSMFRQMQKTSHKTAHLSWHWITLAFQLTTLACLKGFCSVCQEQESPEYSHKHTVSVPLYHQNNMLTFSVISGKQQTLKKFDSLRWKHFFHLFVLFRLRAICKFGETPKL